MMVLATYQLIDIHNNMGNRRIVRVIGESDL